MKTEEYIKNFNGQILGIIETLDNGDQVARSFPLRQVLGFYRAKYNHTTDFLGRVLTRGNSVANLIFNDPNK